MGFIRASLDLEPDWGLTSSLLLLTLVVLLGIASTFRDPLRGIPGPRVCTWTPLWLHYQAWKGTQCTAIRALHAKYGAVVRVAPNEVDIADGAALWSVYMERGGFAKAGCYRTFDIDGHATIFTTLSLDRRAARLKAVQSMFSHAAVAGATGIIRECAERMVRQMEDAKKRKGPGVPLDVLNLTRAYGNFSTRKYRHAR